MDRAQAEKLVEEFDDAARAMTTRHENDYPTKEERAVYDSAREALIAALVGDDEACVGCGHGRSHWFHSRTQGESRYHEFRGWDE